MAADEVDGALSRPAPIVIATLEPIRSTRLTVFAAQFRITPMAPKPNVRQCEVCLAYGHLSDSPLCRASRERCARCPSSKHSTEAHKCPFCPEDDATEDCLHPPQCRNCLGAHCANENVCKMRPFYAKASRSLVHPSKERATEIRAMEKLKFDRLVVQANKAMRERRAASRSSTAPEGEATAVKTSTGAWAEDVSTDGMEEDEIDILLVGTQAPQGTRRASEEDAEDGRASKTRRSCSTADASGAAVNSSPSPPSSQ